MRIFLLMLNKLFRRDIEPAIQTIEEEVKANKFISSLIRKFAENQVYFLAV